MIEIADATAIAQAAQTGVTGCALLSVEDTTDAAWHTVILSTGDLVRVDTVDGSRPNAAIAALLAADFSPGAIANAARQSRAREAVTALRTSTDPVSVATRGALSFAFTLINDGRESRGQSRLTEREIYAGIEAFLAGGAGEPMPLSPLAPIGG